MEDKYLELLKRSNFEELSQDEKEILKDLCTNEMEFERAKSLIIDLDLMDKRTTTSPSLDVNSKLDAEFRQVHAGQRGGGWFRFLFPPLKPIMWRPGIQIAMLFVLFLGSYLMIEFIGFKDQNTMIQLAQEDHNTSQEFKVMLSDSTLSAPTIVEVELVEPKLTLQDVVVLEVNTDKLERSLLTANNHNQREMDLVSAKNISETIASRSRDDFEFDEEPILLGEIDLEIEESEFLIPTAAESPDLLEGLFVTF